MDSSWTMVFSDKLVASKLVTCSLIFTKSRLRKKYSRKHNKPLFTCYARCQYPHCPLAVHATMINSLEPGQNIIFRVQIKGTQKHDDPAVSVGRPLKGAKRAQMGK
jgi:hypothetical protein